MPNTEVKLSSAENTWMETSWEDREVLAFPFKEKRAGFRRYLRSKLRARNAEEIIEARRLKKQSD